MSSVERQELFFVRIAPGIHRKSILSLLVGFLETHIVQHLLENKFVWPNAVVVPTKVWAPNLGLAALEVVVSARTGSVDDRGRFDMRPGAAWRRYSRSGQFLVDVFLLPPWWLLGPPLRRWLAPPPKPITAEPVARPRLSGNQRDMLLPGET